MDEQEMEQDLIDIQKKVLKIGLTSLKINSPLMTIINHHNVLGSKTKTFEEVLSSDLEMAKVVFQKRELFEGIHNLLIEKGKTPPKWMFSSLERVPEEVIKEILNSKSTFLLLDLKFL